MKTLLLIVGILSYSRWRDHHRALYVEPRSAVIITESDIRELPNYARVIGGAPLFVGGCPGPLRRHP